MQIWRSLPNLYQTIEGSLTFLPLPKMAVFSCCAAGPSLLVATCREKYARNAAAGVACLSMSVNTQPASNHACSLGRCLQMRVACISISPPACLCARLPPAAHPWPSASVSSGHLPAFLGPHRGSPQKCTAAAPRLQTNENTMKTHLCQIRGSAACSTRTGRLLVLHHAPITPLQPPCST